MAKNLKAKYNITFNAPKSCKECYFFDEQDGYIPVCTIGGGVFGEKSWRSPGNGWHGYDKMRSFGCPLTIIDVDTGKVVYEKRSKGERQGEV